jgi:hypothetical protein
MTLGTENAYINLLQQENHFNQVHVSVGRHSSVGIATRFGLEGPGIESRSVGDIFNTRLNRPWGLPSLLYNGYRVFPGGKVAGAWC